ncbi:MATE family efflux transporter [candidate division WOR-3 bacterium]|nr:MATE family efflux transporter [candidate division WOR-3 bacterium]
MVVVDAFWIGRLRVTGALAGVGISGSVFAALMVVAQFAVAPTMAFVARYSAENDHPRAQGALFHSFVIAMVLSLLLCLAGVPLSVHILRLLGASGEVVGQGTPYLRILFFILPLAYLGTVGFTALQAAGDTLSPLIISVITNVINIILDPLLILGLLGFPRLGTTGAGIVTALATLANLAAVLFVLNRRRLLAVVRLRLKVIARFLRVGLFGMIQIVTRPLTGLLMFYILGLSGVAAQDAFAVGVRIIGLVFIFLNGLGVATQALVRQSLGAGTPSTALRVVRTSAVYGILIQIFLSVLLFAGAEWIIRIFSPGSEEAIKIGTHYLRILAPFLLLAPVSMAFSGAQYGSGRTLGPAIASVAGNWILKLPLAYVLSQVAGLGPNGVWVAIGASIIVETLVTGIFYASRRWLRGPA